jgi:tRNA nucleotidyltransferase/poly(A) polymerase
MPDFFCTDCGLTSHPTSSWLCQHPDEGQFNIRFFQVGGCVRDELIGTPSKDIDFAVEAPSWEAMAKAVRARCSKVFLETPEFLTIRGLDPDIGAVDFVLCRKDGTSTDGRRPDFVEPGTLFDDLARRDFSVNAMARDEDGVLIDPHGGREDLEAGRLRFVGDPEERLAEDALRAFRGLRFTVTKRFTMTDDTIFAIGSMHAEAFDAVSTDRIRDELHKMFAADTAASITILSHTFPLLLEVALDRGLWLKPTTEERNR